MRVAINLLTDDPRNPSGAHWSLTRLIPEMAKRLTGDEELYLVVSPKSRPLHEGYGPNVQYLTFPWSNESPPLRVLSEHVLTPVHFPRAGIDVFDTLIAPLVRPAPSVVVHFRTMHAYAAASSVRPSARLYRRLGYPHTAKVADAIIINSESLRAEVMQYLDVDPAKLYLVPEAVDHDLFQPGDKDAAAAAIAERYGVTRPFILFVSSLWPYKNAAGLIRAYAARQPELSDRQLVIVGPDRDTKHAAELKQLAEELGVSRDIAWVGGVPMPETVNFYRAADVFVYPSFNETFGLPILEAMASGCPVVTSNVSSMPEVAGGAALLADPGDPESLADAIVTACGSHGEQLRAAGLARAAQMTWSAAAEGTLAVYRGVHARRSVQPPGIGRDIDHSPSREVGGPSPTHRWGAAANLRRR